jgi:Tol biopolymer transport system component
VYFDTSHARLFSVSATGMVTYRNGTPTSQLRWFDRTGKMLTALAEPDLKDGYISSGSRISPDSRRVAVQRRVHDQDDIWIVDEAHANRFTFDGANYPVWSPDSRQIVFRRADHFFTKPADNTQGELPVLDSLPGVGRTVFLPEDWSPDSRFLLYRNVNPQTGHDLWTLPLDGDRKPRVFLQTQFDEKYARFSPDGRWVAYTSNASGRAEVYVRAFAEADADSGKDRAGRVWQISLEGGIFPAWSHDGKELYWVGLGGRIIAAPIQLKGETLEPGAPVQLFQAPIFGGGLDVNTGGEQFDASSDGRFLINTVKDSAATAITLLQNWRSN